MPGGVVVLIISFIANGETQEKFLLQFSLLYLFIYVIIYLFTNFIIYLVIKYIRQKLKQLIKKSASYFMRRIQI